jgi:hypothetical protein
MDSPGPYAMPKETYEKLTAEHRRMAQLLGAARGLKNANAFAAEQPVKGAEGVRKATEKLEQVINGLEDIQI